MVIFFCSVRCFAWFDHFKEVGVFRDIIGGNFCNFFDNLLGVELVSLLVGRGFESVSQATDFTRGWQRWRM